MKMMAKTHNEKRISSGAAWAGAAGVLCLITLATPPVQAADSKLTMNGKVASSAVKTIGGQAYVPLADVAKALGMVVVKTPSGYEIKKPGGANPIAGVTQGKIGDVLFDGKWRFQVLKMENLASYTMKSDSDTYDSAGLSHLDMTTHILLPRRGSHLVVLQCRVTNGQNSRQQLWTAISDEKMNTALTDMDGGSHPPVAYDYNGAPTQTTPLIPGAIMTFPIIFSVPDDARLKDLVFTLHANGSDSYNNVRVTLGDSNASAPAALSDGNK